MFARGNREPKGRKARTGGVTPTPLSMASPPGRSRHRSKRVAPAGALRNARVVLAIFWVPGARQVPGARGRNKLKR